MALSKVTFANDAFKDLMEWQVKDKNIFKKIGELVRDIQRDPYQGIGKPEALRHNLKGWHSRRITQEHRLVYCVENDSIIIASCKGHYQD